MSKMVVFRVASEEYAIPLKFVVSIEKMGKSTPIPHMPNYVKGMMKVRGELIPIIDLEYVFYDHFVETDDDSKLIIIQSEKLSLGILVNEAKEIIEIPDEKIKQIALLSFSNIAYFSGVASLEGRLLTIIAPEILVNSLDGINHLEEYLERG